MLILDTNVLSELMHDSPDPGVLRWFSTLMRQDVFTTAITEGEMRVGAARLPVGKRAERIIAGLHAMFAIDFKDRILPFSSSATPHLAAVVAARMASGRPIEFADSLIAAICLLHGAELATRNTKDFDCIGISLLNPWDKN